MHRNITSLIEAHNGSQFAVGDVQVLRGSCELYAVAFCKLALLDTDISDLPSFSNF